MKLSSRILAFAAIASTSALISCAGPSGYSYKNVTIKLSFNPICSGVCLTGTSNIFTLVPQPLQAGDLIGPPGAIRLPTGYQSSGSCVELTATVTNAPANLTWTIYPTPTPTVPAPPSGTSYAPTLPSVNVGTLSSTTGSQNYYCSPRDIPIYTGATLAQAQSLGIQQGETEVVVSVPADPNNPANVVSQTQTFNTESNAVPSGVIVGTTPNTSLSLPLGGKFQFSGFVTGLSGYYTAPGTTTQIPSQSQVWSVTAPGGLPIVGGNATIGTITNTGLYTAPSAYPASGKTVTISMASAAYPSVVTGGVGQGPTTIVTFQ